MADLRYWVKNEFGRVWGPFGIGAVGRLDLGSGDVEQRIQISTDGRAFQPITAFPDVIKAIEVARANAPPPRRIAEPAPAAAAVDVPPPPPPRVDPVPVAPAPPAEDNSRPPAEGALPPFVMPNLCARAASTALTGVLSVQTPTGKWALHFKKGTPERIDAPRAAEELARFLIKRNAAPVAEVQKALELSGGPEGELLDALISLNLVPMGDVFRYLGEHAVELYARVLGVVEGTFTWNDGKAPPPGSFPIGQKWALLCAHARKLPIASVKEDLGARARSAVYRSGAPLAKIEDLALTAQETRVLATFDGTRSPELIARELPGESDVAFRLALMLHWFAIVSFGPELGGAATPAPAAPTVDELDAAVEKNTAHADPAAAAATGEGTIGKVALKSVAVKVNAPEAAKAEPKPAEPAKAPEPAKPAPKPVAAAATVAPPKPPEPPKAEVKAAPAKAPVAPAKAPVAPAKAPAPAAKAPPAKRPEPPKAPPPKVAPAAHAKAPPKPPQDLAVLLEKWKKANHFEVLGLQPTATGPEVKAAYIALARQHHPDTVAEGADALLRQQKADLTARINEAYSVLGDDKSRNEYATDLATGNAEKVDITPILQAEEDFMRATILVKARKYAEALDLLEKAIVMNPNEAEFYAWRGFAKFCLAKDKRAEFESTMADVAKCVKMNENVAQAYMFSGQMSKIVGDTARAEKAFKKVLELDPKHTDAARELRMLHKS